ncbi:MAG: 5'-methylthioadenosine/S-adenosylhomocysteine nucleosidase [Sphingomonadales bacterium]|nr:5'-methylthioadenosine/S-adenosylhomocysteine nucleosidase [Sphingomonadales bacterium]
MALASAPLPAAAAPTVLDARPRTVILTAFAAERAALEGGLARRRAYRVNGIEVLTGRLAGKPVVLLESGVSMVNAAMTTQWVIDRFRVRRIVFSGIAGGVDPGLAVGDVVAAERWSQYLEVVLARKVGDRFEPAARNLGPEPLPNYGMLFPRPVTVGNAAERARPHQWFFADPGLLALAKTAVADVALARCAPPRGDAAAAPQCLDHQPRVVVGGNGISGPAFADNAEYRAYLFATFHAQVLDMETAATAQVAYANRVPFIAFRSLSDLAGGDGGPNQARIFGLLAARNAAAVVTRFVAALPD